MSVFLTRFPRSVSIFYSFACGSRLIQFFKRPVNVFSGSIFQGRSRRRLSL